MKPSQRKPRRKLEWFLKPVSPPGGGPPLVSNGMLLVWTSREDLQKKFDIQTEEGLFLFCLWWLKNGRREYGSIACGTISNMESYLDWPSNSIPQDASGPIPRRLYLLWCQEEDLKKEFDLEDPQGRQAILDWWEGTGRHEKNAITKREDEAEAPLSAPAKGGNDERRKRPSAAKTSPKNPGTFMPGGVNIVGFAVGESGLGEDVRTAARALRARNIPFCIYDVPVFKESRARDFRPRTHLVEAPVYNTNIIFLPASDTLRIFLSSGPDLFLDRYTIGAWQWELPRVPSGMREMCRLVDEIWASSRYTEDAYRTCSPFVKIRHMRLPVEIETVPEGDRPSFNLPAETFLFLFVFDSLSRYTRKNPMAAVEAFKRAFPGDNRDVGLVIKCMNARPEDEPWRIMMRERQGDSRIILINDTLPRRRLLGLYNCCDALVSLHRAEGFGRTIAEAMLLGKPVIVTNYSGNVDFTTDETAFLVSGRNVPVRKGEYPFWEGQYWCDPDIDEAAGVLKTCFHDEVTTSQIARSGQEYIQKKYNIHVIGTAYEKRLRELGVLAKTSGQ